MISAPVVIPTTTGKLTPRGRLYGRGGFLNGTEVRESIAVGGLGVYLDYGNDNCPGYCFALGGGFVGQP